jgi:signal transduction histidine kinase
VADIGDAARTALAEMRRIVGVLRADTGPEAAGRAPQPGLRQLVTLVAEARAAQRAGVRLVVRGPVRDLDPGVELTAYRIVQEALTNARETCSGRRGRHRARLRGNAFADPSSR